MKCQKCDRDCCKEVCVVRKGKAVGLVAVGLVAGLVLGTVGVSYAATGTGDPGSCGLGVRMGQSIRDAGGRLIDIVAELTGLSADEVQAARAEGDSIAEIAEASGVSSDQVVDQALEVRKEALDAQVASGAITQEQADDAYSRMSARIAERVTAEGSTRPSWAGQGRGQGAGCGACVNQ